MLKCLKIIVHGNVLEENIWLRKPSLWEIRYSVQLAWFRVGLPLRSEYTK
jgi:hypothetical protein